MLDSQIDPEEYDEEFEGLSQEEIQDLKEQKEIDMQEYYLN